MEPEYVLNEMALWEIEPLLIAFERRQRAGWEQSRMVAIVVARSMGAKLTNKDLKLPWDDEEQEQEVATGDDIRAMRQRIKELKKRGNNENKFAER